MKLCAPLGLENELEGPCDGNGRAGGGISEDFEGMMGAEFILTSYKENVITFPGSTLLVAIEVIHSTHGAVAMQQMTVMAMSARSVVGNRKSVME